MRISWDSPDRPVTFGVSQGVLYTGDSAGVPWNGLISVTEKGDASPAETYIDGQKVRSRVPLSSFSGSLSAYMYPDEFAPYDGAFLGVTGQPKKPFGLSYRSNRELHLIYNAMVSPSGSQYSTLSDNVAATSFSWDFVTIPEDVPGGAPTAHFVVSLDETSPFAIADLESLIYGDDDNDAVLIPPAEILEIFESNTTLRITDNGDGTWTTTGPDSAITMLNGTTFQIAWPSAIFIDSTSYRISSL